jgi:hypothetical protein
MSALLQDTRHTSLTIATQLADNSEALSVEDLVKKVDAFIASAREQRAETDRVEERVMDDLRRVFGPARVREFMR